MKLGIDKLLSNPSLADGWGSVALVTHSASTTSGFVPCVEAVFHALEQRTQSGQSLNCIFGPQHGYWQCEPYNMFETPDDWYQLPNGKRIPLLSLYGEKREPTAESIADIDTLLVDLPDIGCRIYTYMTTLAGCINQAAKANKRVVVLDRPNPLGFGGESGLTEGNILKPHLSSFVGWFQIPFRHGLTLGELGSFYIRQQKLNVDYQVVVVEGLERGKSHQIPWNFLPLAASPNMPDARVMAHFPVTVALEGTNISEGRGTTTPFQLIGAPFLDGSLFCQTLEKSLGLLHSSGNLAARPCRFVPSFDKFQGKECHGAFITRKNLHAATTFPEAIAVLASLAITAKDKLEWREKGYEYNFSDNPLDLILGAEDWRLCFEELQSNPTSNGVWSKLNALLDQAKNDAVLFDEQVQPLQLYS